MLDSREAVTASMQDRRPSRLVLLVPWAGTLPLSPGGSLTSFRTSQSVHLMHW
jgi:hypothetical protein